MDKTVKIWDESAYKLVSTYNDTCAIRALGLVNDSIIAVGTLCGEVRLLDVNSMSLISSFVSYSSVSISGLKMLRSNFLVVCGFNGGSFKIWNLTTITNPLLNSSILEGSNMFALEVIDNDTVAIGVGIFRISIWKISTSTRIKTLSTGVIMNSLIYLKTYGLLLSSGVNYFKIWDTTTWTENSFYSFPYSSSNFTKINDYSIFFTTSNTLYSFNLRTNKTTRLTTTGTYYSIAAVTNDLVVVSNQLNSLVFFNISKTAVITNSIISAHSNSINAILSIPSNSI